ncbi:MAG: type II restriction endonuclease [Candidatus Marinimicrobia bacterium]|nr:type II restriction endonuclease [Candidatus Neomarinimicrobiota bacterium]
MNIVKFDFASEFIDLITEEYKDKIDFELVGLLTRTSEVYTLSYDSKILSGIFEILCEPIVAKICTRNKLCLEKSSQTFYPDFTIFQDRDGMKHAVEIKSTYRRFNKKNEVKPFIYTLGSYKSYLRDPQGKKNILYPYHEYCKHWIIGFLYSRNPACEGTEIKQVIEAASLQTPFIDIEWFIQEKHKIAGRIRGSGNTTNIGSIKSNVMKDFQNGKMGFKSKAEFDEYWRNY